MDQTTAAPDGPQKNEAAVMKPGRTPEPPLCPTTSLASVRELFHGAPTRNQTGHIGDGGDQK